MLRKLNAWLGTLTSTMLLATALFLIAFVSAFDYITGPQLSVSIFHLLPITLATWYLSLRQGVIICLLAAASWFAIDYLSNIYTSPIFVYWNAGVRLGFFLSVAFLLSLVKNAMLTQESLAMQDGLTGLANFRAFKQRCISVFNLALRNNRSLAIGYLDLDGFKGINDKFGHSKGDLVLKTVASTLSSRLRSYDMVARLGGDEFAILLPETSLQGAQTFFTALHKSLMEMAVEHDWALGFSVGVAVFTSPKLSPDEAIKFTDDLMYEVKHSGKNRVVFKHHEPELQT